MTKSSAKLLFASIESLFIEYKYEGFTSKAKNDASLLDGNLLFGLNQEFNVYKLKKQSSLYKALFTITSAPCLDNILITLVTGAKLPGIGLDEKLLLVCNRGKRAYPPG